MLTAGITAAVAGLLSLFGIKPGPYLVGVAIVVKVIIVGVSLTLGARMMRRRASAKAAGTPVATADAAPGAAAGLSPDGAEAPRTSPDPERAERG